MKMISVDVQFCMGLVVVTSSELLIFMISLNIRFSTRSTSELLLKYFSINSEDPVSKIL